MVRNLGQILVIDDLVEYAAIYASSGIHGVRDVFPAGQHSDSNAVRITKPTGEILLEDIPDAMRLYRWPEKAPLAELEKQKTVLQEITTPELEFRLTIGATKLRDGNILWFGRTDAEARRYQHNITVYLWLAGILAAAVALLPVIWYSHEVLTPIRAFTSSARAYLPEDDRYRDLVSVYESDFGVCKVVLSRWMPGDGLLMLDSSRAEVLPLQGRSFAYTPLATVGDAQRGQVVGEYTLELRNENAHGVLRGLAL